MGLLKGRVLFQIPDENSLAMRPKCDVLPKGSTRYLRMKPKVPKPLDNRGEKVFPETGRILAAALMPSKAWQLLLLALTGACIYSGTLNHTFQFDSIQQIVENPYIRELKLWWEYTHNRRSFTIFSFALNYHFVEFDVKYWRIVNIIIHLLNAFLVRWLVQLIFKSPAMKESPMGRYSEPIAFFTALLFVAHPLATQSVTYVVQRATSMGVLFYLLSVCLYLVARMQPGPVLVRTLLYAGAVVVTLLGVQTKEIAYTIPLIIVLVELSLLRVRVRLSPREFWVLAGLLFLVVSGLAYLFSRNTFDIFKPIPPSPRNPEFITPMNYLWTQFSVIPKYVQLLLAPVRQNFDYDYPVLESLGDYRALLGLLFILSLFGLAVGMYNRHRIVAFGILWFFITLSIESSFIPLSDVIVEHRTYLPSVAFALILVYSAFALAKRAVAVRNVLVLWVLVLAFAAFQRNKVWKEPIVFWSDVIEKSPLKARGYNNRGAAYSEQGQHELAIADFSNAIALFPNYPLAYRNRSLAYVEQQEWDKALEDANKAIDMITHNADLFFTRGQIYYNLRQADLALQDYDQAIALDPAFWKAYTYRGILYLVKEEWEKALADFDTSIAINPDQPEISAYRDIAIKGMQGLENSDN
jgi:tetratricopeptide (TPR) repeat protein